MQIHRASDSDFAVEGRTLEGVALRLERASRVSDDGWKTSYYEAWAGGAFPHIGPSYELDRQHDHNSIGQVVFSLSKAERALMFTAVVDESDQGDQLLADVASGEWTDVSISAVVKRSQKRRDAHLGPVTWRLHAELGGLSVARTGSGLSKGAEVLAMRAVTGTPRLDALRRRVRYL